MAHAAFVLNGENILCFVEVGQPCQHTDNTDNPFIWVFLGQLALAAYDIYL